MSMISTTPPPFGGRQEGAPEVLDEAIVSLAAALARQAACRRERVLLLLCGSPAWLTRGATAIAGVYAGRSCVWIGEGAPAGMTALPSGQARRLLGDEVDLALFHVGDGLDADAFGAVAGAVRAGGTLLLLLPPRAEGRFARRFRALLGKSPEAHWVIEGTTLPPSPPPCEVSQPPEPPEPPEPWSDECLSADQAAAVEALERVVRGHRRRPLVLTADRGRGKSSALGIAAARLLRQGVGPILVTAPRPQAVAPLFDQAARLLPGAKVARGCIEFGGVRLEFHPPDELFLAPRDAALLLVDEAAAIPAQVLERLLRRYSRIAFSTTVHGYEGSGRGFEIRFKGVLARLAPGWREQRLETPIRWAAGDPLERAVFSTLLLDAEPAPWETVAALRREHLEMEWVRRDLLVEDEPLLREIFGLLVLAHYRTTPADLRRLLDQPGLALFVARAGRTIVGVVLVVREGGLDRATARAVFEGRRRPTGNLLPDSLAAHAGLVEAPCLLCARLMRIAVHPALQGRGVGGGLVRHVGEWAEEEGYDYLGASFGATAELLRFWRREALEPVRVGFSRDHASGAHSVMVMRPLSPAGERLHDAARARFAESLPHELGGPLRELEPAVVAELLLGDGAVEAPAATLREELDAFAQGLRSHESSLLAVWSLTLQALRRGAASGLTDEALALLVARVVQRRGWSEVAASLGLTGRAEAERRLRTVIARLM